MGIYHASEMGDIPASKEMKEVMITIEELRLYAKMIACWIRGVRCFKCKRKSVCTFKTYIECQEIGE